jgi:hypothetical protein
MPTLREGRDAYLAENGFTVASYDDRFTRATFFGLFDFFVPNTPAHRDGIMRHDLHHVVTGYGTDQIGEGEISMWEVRRGLFELGPYVGAIVASGALFGCLLSPRRMWRAWRSARGGRTLFGAEDYDALLDEDLDAVRRRLGVPSDGVCTGIRKLHARAPRR